MGVNGLVQSSYGAAVLQKKAHHARRGRQRATEYTRRLPTGSSACNFVTEELDAIRGAVGRGFHPRL